VSERAQNAVRAKVVYKWYQRYYDEAQKTLKIYNQGLKRKVLSALYMNYRKMSLKNTKAVKLRKETLKVKAYQIWIAFTLESKEKKAI
jgi:hypothetical protein